MKSDIAQPGKTIENFVRELRIEFFVLRHIGLDGRNVNRLSRRRTSHAVKPECEEADNSRECQCEVEVWSHLFGAGFKEQSQRRRDGDDVGKGNYERQSRHTSKLS